MLLLTSLAVLVSLPVQAEKSDVENVVVVEKDVGQQPFVLNATNIVINEANEVKWCLTCDQCPLMGTVLQYRVGVEGYRPSDHQLAAGSLEDGRFRWEAGLLRPGWRSTITTSCLSAAYDLELFNNSAGGLARI